MNIYDLISSVGQAFGTGPDSDVVISSRVRLARNVAEYPFMSRLTVADSTELLDLLRPIAEQAVGKDSLFISMQNIDGIDRQFLIERHIISRELGTTILSSGAVIGEQERACVMINEEDHLRIQVIQSGYQLDGCMEEARRIDEQIAENVVYAYHDKLGYLTACPTNVGTGMRVSVMLHLPALVLTRQIERVFRSLQKITLTVRGLYGEGSQSQGDFFQISNQTTLGVTEEELEDKLEQVIPSIIDYERKARQHLLEENRESVCDRVRRAYEILSSAQAIKSGEAMMLFSTLRMGVHCNLIDDIDEMTLNQLILQTQSAHLQKILDQEMDPPERDFARSKYIKGILNKYIQKRDAREAKRYR